MGKRSKTSKAAMLKLLKLETMHEDDELEMSKPTHLVEKTGKKAKSRTTQDETVTKGHGMAMTNSEIRDEKDKKQMPNFDSPGSIVTFKVKWGDDTQIYKVHKEFACYYSPLLNAAFNGDSDIAKSQIFPINEGTTLDAFHLLVQWLYRQDITLDSLAADFDIRVTQIELCDSVAEDEAKVIELWVLAGKLRIPHLQNLAMDRLVDLYELYPSTVPNVAYVYQNTPTESVLRRLYVKKIVYAGGTTIFYRDPQAFPHEFLIEVIIFREVYGRDGEPIRAEDYYVGVE